MTVAAAVQAASARIDRRDAELLLLHTTGQNKAWLRAHPEAELPPASLAAFQNMVGLREGNWPLQYLTGYQEFFGLTLEVTPDVLIPRPETELLIEAVLDVLAAQNAHSPRILDVGTGSGAIALALATRLPRAEILALDLSPAVQPVVQRNTASLGLMQRVRFRQSDLLQALGPDLEAGQRWDVVVSNPPYIPLTDQPTLEPQVRDHEPHLALFAGEDGLAIYRRLIPQAWSALRPGGLLAMEFGFAQQPALEHLLTGWSTIRFLNDYAGIPRIALAERPDPS